MAGAPPLVLLCTEAHTLADASSLYVSRLLGTLRDMGNERHRFFLHVRLRIPTTPPTSPPPLSRGRREFRWGGGGGGGFTHAAEFCPCTASHIFVEMELWLAVHGEKAWQPHQRYSEWQCLITFAWGRRRWLPARVRAVRR